MTISNLPKGNSRGEYACFCWKGLIMLIAIENIIA